MNHSAETQQTFFQILKTETVQTQSLLDLLRMEYEMLQSSSSQALQDLLEKKKQQLISVETVVTTHNQFLEQQGLSIDKQGTDTFLHQCNDNEQLLDMWHRLTSLLEACRSQNEINGGAVQLNQRHVSQALDILRGISERDKTYGPSGESRPNSTSKSLGKA
ncbi:MAG: flagellar protein FlgN [Candidatus Thiodiazotropha sp. (ex Ustalcina ferruginea)]|nr:flagellar protein FlgN [Candidatus Thiodiazotropha sp. (ex Ustalcina ferruginea)]